MLHDTSKRSLAGLLLRQATERPGSLALVQAEKQLTYQELLERVRNTAAHLKQRGLQPGDTIALLFQNTIDCVVTYLACAWQQLCLIPLEPGISAEYLASMRKELDFTWIAGQEVELQSFMGLQHIYVEQIHEKNNDSMPEHRPDSVFVYHYTSGSTGLPKAAMHSQENLINGGIIYQRTFHLEATDRILAAVPVLHSFGMVGGIVAALVCGSALVLLERFTPGRLLQTIVETHATLLLAVPLMYELLTVGRTVAQETALRVCLSTGGELPGALLERFQRISGQWIYHVYGCSEVGIIAAQTPDDPLETRGSVGRPVVGVEVCIKDEAGDMVAVGEVGTIEVRTPAMFHGYYHHLSATEEVLRAGWYMTCDLARQDEQGYLYLCGRKETFINVGGKKVNALLVEQVLCAHPAVREAVVWAEATERTSERVGATVVVRTAVSVADLLAFCRARLQPYQVPVVIDLAPSLQRTAMGKIQRKRMTDPP